ncbi:MAG: PD-(D/E)XK nuclease family protein [Christensenellaceae bacterium]
MSVEFVLGRTASKRDETIIDKIGALIKNDCLNNVLVVVPPQSTYITECMILDRLRVKGMMGICVQSPARICDRVLEETFGRAVASIDAAGKSMIIKLILDEKKYSLASLYRCAKKSDMPMQLAEIISELKTLDITPEMLRELPVENDHTAAKFCDIAKIYECFNEMKQGIMDNEDKINLVIEHIKEAEFIKNSHVIVHGFDMYNAQTVRFIKALMNTARDTTISFLYAEPSAPDADVYGICNENREKFIDDAMKLGLTNTVVEEDRKISADLLNIERNLYTYTPQKKRKAQDVSLVSAASMDEEIRAVSAQIAYLTQKCGYRFSQIAVVCADALAYAPKVKQRFDEANIPCFVGEKRPLCMSEFCEFILSAIELMQGRLKKDTILAHIKTGFCEVDMQQISILQNYAFCNIRDGFAFTHPFSTESAERARLAVMNPIELMRKRANRKVSAVQLIDILMQYLSEMDVTKKLSDKIERMKERELFESAEFNTQVFERCMKILQQAKEIVKDKPIGKTQMLKMIRAGFDAQSIGVIPPGANEVNFGDISYVRLADIRVLFVMGANEGSLPNYVQTSDILAEHERELLLSKLVGVHYTGNVEKQKLAILKAFSKPSEKLFISYIDDSKSVRSSVIDRLFEMFSEIKTTKAKQIVPMLKQNAYALGAVEFRKIADGTVCTNEEVIAEVLNDTNTDFSELRTLIKNTVTKPNVSAKINFENAQALYGDVAGSASRIESFYSCPYKHFMDYGLHIKAPQEYTINSMDMGSYAHNVLDLVSKEIKAAGKRWGELDEKELTQLVHKQAGEVRLKESKYKLNKHNENVLNAIEKEIIIAANVIKDHTMHAELQPNVTEHWFLQDFDGVQIQGVIDRIDTAEIDGKQYFSIVDYKTSQKDFHLYKLANGIGIQLAIYIMAAMELLGNDAQFAGANYFTIHLPIFEEPTEMDDEFKMNGIIGTNEDLTGELYGVKMRGIYALKLNIKRDTKFDAASTARHYDKKELETVLKFTEKLVTDAVSKIKEGENEILPVLVAHTQTPCTYCDYISICRADDQTKRQVETMNKESAFALIQEKMKPTLAKKEEKK